MGVVSYATPGCPNDINLFERVATCTCPECGFSSS
jgi:hypothetical protein